MKTLKPISPAAMALVKQRLAEAAQEIEEEKKVFKTGKPLNTPVRPCQLP